MLFTFFRSLEPSFNVWPLVNFKHWTGFFVTFAMLKCGSLNVDWNQNFCCSPLTNYIISNHGNWTRSANSEFHLNSGIKVYKQKELMSFTMLRFFLMCECDYAVFNCAADWTIRQHTPLFENTKLHGTKHNWGNKKSEGKPIRMVILFKDDHDLHGCAAQVAMLKSHCFFPLASSTILINGDCSQFSIM